MYFSTLPSLFFFIQLLVSSVLCISLSGWLPRDSLPFSITSPLAKADSLQCKPRSCPNLITCADTSSTQQNPDDVVITLAIRTPLTKGFKGGFKDTPLDYIIYSLLKEVVTKSNIDPQLVEDVCLGNVCLSPIIPKPISSYLADTTSLRSLNPKPLT